MPSTKFDPTAFAQGLVDPLREAVSPFLASATADAKALVAQFDVLEGDVTRTLLALEAATDDKTRALLQDDLTKFLPARKQALIAEIVSKGASDAEAVAEVALTVLVKAATIAAKSFVPIP
jgi:hypothetical protein